MAAARFTISAERTESISESSREGNSVGTYKGAFPHIGEALFTRKAVMDCGDFNRAFQKAAQLGGRQFLQDMFSSKPSQEFIEVPAPPGMGMQMM